MEKKQYLKTYYQRNRETLLQKQKDLYEKNKEQKRAEYQQTYFTCECGKQVSRLRKEMHEITKYHKSRTNRLVEDSQSRQNDGLNKQES